MRSSVVPGGDCLEPARREPFYAFGIVKRSSYSIAN